MPFIVVAAALIFAAIGVRWLLHRIRYVSTDDAQIKGARRRRRARAGDDRGASGRRGSGLLAAISWRASTTAPTRPNWSAHARPGSAPPRRSSGQAPS
jgi:hypothetical protein